MTALLATIFTLGFAAQVIKIAVPYALAAMGGAITEKSGVIDLALEAKLLFGAFTAAAIGHATGSAVLGLAGGIAAGMIVAAVQAGCALGFGANQVIVGVALNTLGLAGTRFLLQLVFGEGSNSPPCPAYGSEVVRNPFVWLTVIATAAVPLALRRTRWGVRLRAAGDRPDALVAVGASPTRARLAAALVGGALAGAGGAQLSLAVGGFVADMSAGRGYIALAAVIFGNWRPFGAFAAALLFGGSTALSFRLQQPWPAPSVLFQALPYVLTLIAVAGVIGRSVPPAAAGRPYVKQ